MKLSTKIIIALVVFVILVIVFFAPGYFPIRPLEPIFSTLCTRALNGDFNAKQETDFVGFGGAPIRNDYAECGVTPAYDANRVCYVAPSTRPSFLGGDNPLGGPTIDDCYTCEFGFEDILDGKYLIGKSCRPYKFIWRWVYKTNF